MGYAFLEDESEEERAALQRRLEKTFGTDHLLYLAGDKEDVENAKKAGKSLGIYLAEQILAGENFHKVVNEATEEEVLELLEKNPCSMTDQALKEMIQQKLSDYEDADDLEKEENADRDDEQNEDILEPQKERNEEQEESASGEKLEEVGESKESDELDTINEPESQVEEHESDTQDISDEPAEPTEEIDSYEMESEDDSTESEGEESEISGPASQVGHPHLRGCHQEREGTYCHDNGQCSSRQSDFRREYPQKCQNADGHNQNAQTVRETIRIVLHVPLMFRLIELALFQLILLVLRGTLCIKEAHERAVRHKRDNPFSLIIPEFQPTNPYENNQDGYTNQINTQLLSGSGQRQRSHKQVLQFRFHLCSTF